MWSLTARLMPEHLTPAIRFPSPWRNLTIKTNGYRARGFVDDVEIQLCDRCNGLGQWAEWHGPCTPDLWHTNLICPKCYGRGYDPTGPKPPCDHIEGWGPDAYCDPTWTYQEYEASPISYGVGRRTAGSEGRPKLVYNDPDFNPRNGQYSDNWSYPMRFDTPEQAEAFIRAAWWFGNHEGVIVIIEDRGPHTWDIRMVRAVTPPRLGSEPA